MTTEHDTSENETTTEPPTEFQVTAYQDALATYLEAANWLTPADGIFQVNAEQIARTLDRQLTRTGEVQSALVSTFHKAMAILNTSRPRPAAPAEGIRGQTQVFDFLE